MKFPAVEKKTVLVTGCSSGIGETTAVYLKERGWTVWPTARKVADLDRLREKGFEPVELDIAKSESVQKAAGEIKERLGGALGALVNNAGFGQPGALEDVSREALRYQFEVNLFGMQELTNAFIPGFREQGYGRIVNVSSVVGRVCLPFYGAYSSTKFAMEALSDALRVELRSTGTSVSLIEPGPIATEFGNNAAVHAQEDLPHEGSRHQAMYEEMIRKRQRTGKMKPFTLPPEAVARKIFHALESSRPKARYAVTLPAHVGALMSRFAPTWMVDALMSVRWESRMGPTS
jgi:short-subunit dehydrogenase